VGICKWLKGFKIKNWTQLKLISVSVLFLVLFYNYTFFFNVLEVYPLDSGNYLFILSIITILTTFNILLITIFSSKYTTKPILITLFLVSSLTSYFMNTYHIIIDDSMIRNMMQTDIHESLDLLTLKQAISFIFLGILPALIVYKSKIKYQPLKAELLLRLKVVVITIILILVSFFSFSQKYISFVREHKPLRFSVNPTYWVYSIGKYININIQNGEIIVAPLGRDAKVVKSDVNSSAKLIIMVVGEATRADHFSLNGYEKETNPLLKQEDIINFSNLYSCGTSTAASVPCMFSVYPRSEFSYKKGLNTENVLDVLNHTQAIEILWRDNNSDSKGVALRVPYFDYKGSQYNTIIEEGESRDIGLLVGLDEYVSNHKNQDILIVLHQMGNHGPAYYKRYTKEFEMFTPTCKTNLLEDCTKEEISNTYDNALIYTDNFLVQAINFLKEHDKTHTTALIYMSDHGESLGENGIYLHGLPYFMAPDAQIHVAALMWFGEKMKESINTKVLKKKSSHNYSHDNLFHTLLGIFEVQTKVYDKKLDILNTK